MKIITTVIPGLMLFFAISSGYASTIVWTNTTSGNWTDSINWSPNQIPGASDTAVITNSGTYTITLDVDAKVGGLILGSTNGAGTQTVSMNFRNFSLGGQATVNASGQFDLSSGTFSGGVGGGVMVGDWVFSGAALSGTLTLASNSVLNLLANIDFFQTVLTNYGTVNWEAGTLSGHNSPWFYNYGLWDAQANNQLYNDSGYYNDQMTTFNNYGTFRKSGGTGDGSNFTDTYLDQTLSFNNAGTLDVQSGTVIVGSGVGSGTFETATNARTYLSIYTLTGDPVFAGDGTVDGSLIGDNVRLHGTINLNQSGFQGTLTIASNAVLNLLANIDFSYTILTNYGTVNWEAGTLSGHYSPWFYNYGLWDAKANNQFYNDSGYYNDQMTTFNNYGTFRKSGGTGDGSNFTDTYLDQTLSFNNAGTLDVQTGVLEMVGNFALAGGTLNFGIHGLANYGSIILSGEAILAGDLSVNLATSFSPVDGNTFALVSYGAETGTFTMLNLPRLSGGLIWQTNYGATTFSLVVTDAPPFALTTTGITQYGDEFSFSFEAIEGQSYQVQTTTNLAPPNWMDVGDPIVATNNWMPVFDAVGSDSHRFYRVVLQ